MDCNENDPLPEPAYFAGTHFSGPNSHWTNRITMPAGKHRYFSAQGLIGYQGAYRSAQGIIEHENGTIEPFRPFRPGSLLVMSDIHRGADISALPEHEASLTRQMSAFEHVVMNGDNFEMFYIDHAFYGMQAPPKKGRVYEALEETDDDVPDADGAAQEGQIKESSHAHHLVKKSIKKSVAFLRDFLEKNPQTHLHFVLGNHELIRKFRHKLDQLQKDYPNNFEWSAEAIKIGDAMFVHGDLPLASWREQTIAAYMNGELNFLQMCGAMIRNCFHTALRDTDSMRHDYAITDDERITHRLREAKDEIKWTKTMVGIEGPGQSVIDWLRQPKKCLPMLHYWLKRYDGTKDANGMPEMRMSENGVPKPFRMKDIKHVFFGHTHVKFHNLEPHEYGGLVFHNTGALTKTVMKGNLIRNASGHGMLEADIKDGKIHDVRPFALENNLGQLAYCR